MKILLLMVLHYNILWILTSVDTLKTKTADLQISYRHKLNVAKPNYRLCCDILRVVT